MKFINIFFAVAFAFIPCQVACGALITVQVQGLVTGFSTSNGVSYDGSVQVGTYMTGTCVYQTDVPDEVPSDTEGYYSAISSISMSIGNYGFEYSAGVPESARVYVSLWKDGHYTVTASSIKPRFMGTLFINGVPKTLDLIPTGDDDTFGTADDGFKLQETSPCIDAADGNSAPERDIIGAPRFDRRDITNTGIGYPKYADIGAYEYQPAIVIMCWIDESHPYVYWDHSADIYDEDLQRYQNMANQVPTTFKMVVKAGCLVPYSLFMWGEYGSLADVANVLPEGYSAPDEISVEVCSFGEQASQSEPDLEQMQNDFERIREVWDPIHVILITDHSASLSVPPNASPPNIDSIQPGYGDFKDWLDENYPGTVIEVTFTHEQWVKAMADALEDVLDDL